MKRTIQILSLVLVVQLALAAGLWLLKTDTGTVEEQGRLLPSAKEQIDQVEIDGGPQGKVELRKVDGKWLLPGRFDAPADARKVEEMLTTLFDIQRSWPVAETQDAVKRFKVADDDFERRLTFKSGDKEQAVLLLGSSPGFRKVHARVAGEQEVFDILYSTYQASLKAEDWLDKHPLRMAADQVSAVDLPDCRLVADNGQWQVQDLAAGEQTNGEEARRLLDRLTDPAITDIYAKAGQALPKPVILSIKLEMRSGESRQYDFAEGDEASYALLRVTDAPYLYKVSTSELKDLQETNRAKLVQPKEAAGPPSQDQNTSAPAPPRS